MRVEAGDAPAQDAPSDPLADLLFTLIAAVLPAILLLAPLSDSIRQQAAVKEAGRRSIEAGAGATLRGVPVRPLVAGTQGLSIGGRDGRHILLDRIGADAGLAAMLEGIRRDGEPLLLLIEPDGIESAFQFEPVAAAHGPARFDEVRLTTPCAAATDGALRVLCAGAP